MYSTPHRKARAGFLVFPYQLTEELDITDTEILDPYIIMSDYKMVDNPALLT